MSRTRILLGAVSALALATMATSSANAQVFNGTVEGDYSSIEPSGHGGSIDAWGGGGSVETALGSLGLNAQLDAGYHDISAFHHDISDYNVGGDLFWQGDRGRLGATVNYQNFNCCGITVDATNYGAFAELYVMPELTVGVKGGAFSGNIGIGGVNVGLNGAYVGGQAEGYIMPDLALTGMIDYTSYSHGISEDDYTAQAEWLVSEQTPVSVTFGYTRSNFSGTGGNANTFMVGLKLYLDGNGAQTLVDRQRSANESWGSKFDTNGIAFQF